MNEEHTRSRLKLVAATPDRLEHIVDLVNAAYRGDSGWTKETDIIAGHRTTREEIASLLADDNTHVLLAVENRRMLACICIEYKAPEAHIGLFAVSPQLQGNGLGKQVLALAEDFAREQLHAQAFVMAVISQRSELMAYYERRGYVKTGRLEPFPTQRDVGDPKISGLTIAYLEKDALMENA